MDDAPSRSRLAGCAGGCASAVATVAAALMAGLFAARDVVSTWMPDQARAVGLGWLADQQRPVEATDRFDGGECALEWRRDGVGSARYTITCTAERELAVEGLVLTASPVGGGSSWVGPAIYEEQRPRSGETVRVAPGRAWTYDGEITVSNGLVGGGADAVTLEARVTVGDEVHEVRITSAER